jgi:hypothetical protein
MTRTLRPLAVLAVLALMGAGFERICQERAPPDQNATARDRAVRIADCMRENGVNDFPDPNADGRADGSMA